MPGTITTDQVVIKAAEVVADYLVLGTFASAQALNDDIKVEGTNGINGRVSANTAWSLAAAAAAIDMTVADTHVWMWLRLLTWPSTDTKANGGLGISISSDVTPTLTGVSPSNGPTNSKTWYLAGSDTDSVTGWACYCVDPNGTPDLTIGTPVISSVDRVGLRCKVTGTVSNKTLNVHHDVVRYGTGLTIKDGTGRAPAALVDVFTTDSSNTNAWGVVTNAAGIYFIAGKLKLGTTGQTAETVFEDNSQVVVFQKFPVAASFYEVAVNGAAGQETTLRLGTYTPLTNLTANGCTIKGAGDPASATHAIWTLTASAANQVTKLYGCVLSELRSAALAFNTVSPVLTTNCTTNATTTLVTSGSYDTSGITVGMSITGTNIPANTYVASIESATSLTMSLAATGSAGSLTMTFSHSSELRGCTISNSGAITTNGCKIDKCTFQDVKTTAPISATSALIINSATEMSRVTNSSFIKCGNAIKITAAGTYAFSNLNFIGNTFDVENSSAGAVIINVTGGSANPITTFTNTGGGSVTINNLVSVTLTGMKDNTEVRVYAAGTTTELAGTESATTGGTDNRSFSFSSNAATSVDIRIHNVTYEPEKILAFSVPSVDASIPIQQRFDRNYSNP